MYINVPHGYVRLHVLREAIDKLSVQRSPRLNCASAAASLLKGKARYIEWKGGKYKKERKRVLPCRENRLDKIPEIEPATMPDTILR